MPEIGRTGQGNCGVSRQSFSQLIATVGMNTPRPRRSSAARSPSSLDRRRRRRRSARAVAASSGGGAGALRRRGAADRPLHDRGPGRRRGSRRRRSPARRSAGSSCWTKMARGPSARMNRAPGRRVLRRRVARPDDLLRRGAGGMHRPGDLRPDGDQVGRGEAAAGGDRLDHAADDLAEGDGAFPFLGRCSPWRHSPMRRTSTGRRRAAIFSRLPPPAPVAAQHRGQRVDRES